jgi:hypothetical protein
VNVNESGLLQQSQVLAKLFRLGIGRLASERFRGSREVGFSALDPKEQIPNEIHIALHERSPTLGTMSLGANRHCKRFFGLGDKGADDRVGRISTSLLVDHALHRADCGFNAGRVVWIEFEFRNLAVQRGHRGLRFRELTLQLI